jgi:hypothetical protein
VAMPSKARFCGRSLAGVAGSNLAGPWLPVSCECCVLPVKGLCDGPIPRLEEPIDVSICDPETS